MFLGVVLQLISQQNIKNEFCNELTDQCFWVNKSKRNYFPRFFIAQFGFARKLIGFQFVRQNRLQNSRWRNYQCLKIELNPQEAVISERSLWWWQMVSNGKLFWRWDKLWILGNYSLAEGKVVDKFEKSSVVYTNTGAVRFYQ